MLPETAALIGDAQVRNRGTIGGSVAHADPSADYPTVLKALGATITATGKGGERTIAADDFFRGIFTTALEPDELVTTVNVRDGERAAYVKHRHPASFYAVVGVACVVRDDDARIVIVGGVTGTAGPDRRRPRRRGEARGGGGKGACRAHWRDRRHVRVRGVPRPPGAGVGKACDQGGARSRVEVEKSFEVPASPSGRGHF